MKTIKAFLLIALAGPLADTAMAEIRIRDYPPGVPVNGAVVPTEATFTPPLAAGQTLLIEGSGIEVLRVEVTEGEVSKISTRIKMPESGDISYRRVVNGTVQESALIPVQIKDGVRPSGPASRVQKSDHEVKEAAKDGAYRMLVYTENGLGSTIVLSDTGFKIRVVGTNALSDKFFLAVEGSFSGKLTSEFVAR